MFGIFAGVAFTVSEDRVQTFQDMSRETASRWATHEVISAKPKQEFLGPNLDSISFKMVLTAWRGTSPLALAEQLRSFCQKGKYGHLILGGKNFGKYVIESISENYEIVTNSGQVIKSSVDVTLKEYH